MTSVTVETDPPDRGVSFLVVGLARSGTTLAQRLVCEIDEVWVPRETHFWSRYLGRDGRFASGHLSSPAVRSLLRTMQQPGEPIALTSDERSRILMRVDRDGCSPWELFGYVVDALSPDGPQTLGEKTPSHAGITTRLLAAHPELKVVGIVRDPRAVFASMLGVSWGLRDSQRLAWRWRLLHDRLLTDVDAFGAHRVMLVRYEDVVADPAGFQQAVATLVDVPLTVNPVADQQLFRPQETWKQLAVEAPDLRRIDAWRMQLDPVDVALIEAITAPVAERFGYDPVSRLTPPLSRDPAALWQERQIAAQFDVARDSPGRQRP